MAKHKKKFKLNVIPSKKSRCETLALKYGDFVWATLNYSTWWPAIIINHTDCGKPPAREGYVWVFWFGDHKVSQVSNKWITSFTVNYEDIANVKSGKMGSKAIHECIEILATKAAITYENVNDLYTWARKGFENLNFEANNSQDLPSAVKKYLKAFKVEDECESSNKSAVYNISDFKGNKQAQVSNKVAPKCKSITHTAGEFVWARISRNNWWPAIIINSWDCVQVPAQNRSVWVFLFGDHRISQVSKQQILSFTTYFDNVIICESSEKHYKAVCESLEVLAATVNYSFETKEQLFAWAKKNFKNLDFEAYSSGVPPFVLKHLDNLKGDSPYFKEFVENISDYKEGGQAQVSEKVASECKNITYTAGEFVWARISHNNWWPAVIINSWDCSQPPARNRSVKVFLFGDHRISQVSKQQILKFTTHFDNIIICESSEMHYKAVCESLEVLAATVNYSFETKEQLFAWAEKNFKNLDFEAYSSGLPPFVLKHLDNLKGDAPCSEEFVENISNHKESRQAQISDEEIYHCKDITYKVGEFVWAKISGNNWWPAIIINSLDCAQAPARSGYLWVFWFGDHKISQVSLNRILKFTTCYMEMTKSKSGMMRQKAICESLEILASTLNYSFNNVQDLFTWAEESFKNLHSERDDFKGLPQFVLTHLNKFKNDNVPNTEEFVAGGAIDVTFEKMEADESAIEDFCIACRKKNAKVIGQHPLFKGGLCIICRKHIKTAAYTFGDDGNCVCCIICGEPGKLILCDAPNCNRSYCTICIASFLGTAVKDTIIKKTHWQCFFCSPSNFENCILQIQNNWKSNLASLVTLYPSNVSLADFTEKKPITVLSLFDGIGTGKVVLDVLGIAVDKYYACEIDEAAVNITRFHHRDSVIQLGNVCDITQETIKSLGEIDLLIGGSPCNDFSLVNPARKGLYDITSSGQLYFDYFHILNLVRQENSKLLYLFENVSMPIRERTIISSFFMHEPVTINARDYSPQRRLRSYWGNIPGLYGLQKFWNKIPNDDSTDKVLKEYILQQIGREPMVETIKTITTQRNSLIQSQSRVMPVQMNGEPDVLWITEIEKIFGFPMHYTDVGDICITKRRELLGKGWSIPVIKAILMPLRCFFQTT